MPGGGTLRLAAFTRDGPVVVNVWASWCAACRREAPLLEAAWRTYRHQVQFVGINHRDQQCEALAFIHEFDLLFRSGADPTGEIANAFGLIGVPTTHIEQGGHIHATKIGEISGQDLENHMQSLPSTRALEPSAAERTRFMESLR